MNINIFERILLPLKRKIMLIIGKCILVAVDNSNKNMKLQLSGLKNESITNIERYQEYGFESYPKKDSEVLAAFIDGNRDNGIVICVNDKRYRPTDLNEGDVCVYDHAGLRITLNSTGIIIKTGDASTWKPNVLAVDPFTGMPHGGIPAGITKLKGA
jgi:phage baseplate assembly protein V